MTLLRFTPPVEDPRRFLVFLLDRATGEVAVVEHEYPYDDESLCFQYGQGNYRCDCNRVLFFYDHRDIDAPRLDEQRPWRAGNEISCSHERFFCAIADLDGTLIYQDDEG